MLKGICKRCKALTNFEWIAIEGGQPFFACSSLHAGGEGFLMIGFDKWERQDADQAVRRGDFSNPFRKEDQEVDVGLASIFGDEGILAFQGVGPTTEGGGDPPFETRKDEKVTPG